MIEARFSAVKANELVILVFLSASSVRLVLEWVLMASATARARTADARIC